MDDYLSKLNIQQREAVVYIDGPQLVIAGAGSGKTRVLTYKIVHLLTHGYEPWRILALTFTNKAAREMRDRITELVGGGIANKLWMGTFHSIFSRILHIHADRIGFSRNFTIYDSADSKSLIKTIVKDMGLDDKIYKPSTVAGAISMAKNALLSPEAYAGDRDLMEADRRAKRPLLYAIYRTYMQRCHVAEAMDFDDLLYYTHELLRGNPDILNHYREFFRYVLVDEYQDTNFAQHQIITLLTKGLGNLSVVGDDAQSIYSFRGANIRNILTLKNTYPDLRIFKLEQNYRSTQNIINAANSLIEKNTEQIRKQVFSQNEEGAPIEVVQSYSDFDEGALVANRISLLKMQSHHSYRDFAILYRTNRQSRILEELLRKRNIPYRIYGGLSFYQRKEIKDAVAYFRMAVNPDDDEALKRIINFPARGIGETTLNKLTRCAINGNTSIWDVLTHPDQHDLQVNSGTMKKLDGFVAIIQSFVDLNEKGIPADELSTYIIQRTQLISILQTDQTPENINKLENLDELLDGCRQFVNARNEEGRSEEISLSHFLREISLATDFDQDGDDDNENKVSLMTVHASKGLEFENVIVVGVEENLFPAAMSMSSISEIEEERRLLYVAITRARKKCILSFVKNRFQNGENIECSQSRFLRDIDKRYLHMATGSTLSGGSEWSGFNPVSKYQRSNYGGGNMRQSVSSFNPGGNFQPLSEVRRTASTTAATPAGGFRNYSAEELEAGNTIEHQRFGQGVIIKVDTSQPDARITVKFSNIETKILLLKFAKIKLL
ncbi:MAG: UvrD-helicase domain-containing protein [Muribaculaceae bacterium]|nr:UvrD-helicase domain-containing protein [Muribaculaceae bacterium]